MRSNARAEKNIPDKCHQITAIMVGLLETIAL
jgi:hypothetical protein